MQEKIKVYGIKNCDTMKKTFKLLEENGMEYDFHDYKKEQPTAELLASFLSKVPLEVLLNKRGTTYRKLSDDEKVQAETVSSAIPLLAKNSSMIKRPVMVFPDGDIQTGFKKDDILSKK